MSRPALSAAAVSLFVALAPAGAGLAAPDAPSIILHCYANARGLGVCTSPACPALTESCDAAHPCSDGEFCAFGTGCASNFTGVCKTSFGACSNPGTAPAGCEPVIYDEDFSTVGAFDPGIQCGAGGGWFKEEAVCAGALAPTPLDHLRWGIAPGNCSSFGSAGHRAMTESGTEYDVSGCAGGVLDFDYLVELQEDGRYDRAIVTVAFGDDFERVVATSQGVGEPTFGSIEYLSCGGGVPPVGNLIADGAWHHFRIGLGNAAAIGVRFYGETYDSENNNGRGFLIDDFRVDCGDHIFANGFEGGNALSWSDAIGTPPLIYDVFPGGSCDTDYLPCGGPDANCYNVKTAGGTAVCISSSICGDPCTSNGDCGLGEVCLVETCCEGGSTCAPARCDPFDAAIFGVEPPPVPAAPTTVGAAASLF